MSFNLVPVAYAAANEWSDKCQQDGVATIAGIECLIENILTPLPGLIALAAVFMIIWAGIRLMNAGSDQKAYASAWSTFTYAVVGLILLSVVWFALILIGKFTGADVTNLNIGS